MQCDKCSARIPSESKFCPQCGDPVTELNQQVSNVDTGAPAQVELTFGYSSSPSYKQAVELCSNVPTFETTGEGREARHKLTLPITEVELVSKIYDIIGGWKSTTMLIDGYQSTKKDLSFGAIRCYRERQKAWDKEKYCYGEVQQVRNIWGCKRLNMPIYEWGGGWLDYGSFDAKGVWHFDKARIASDLQAALKGCELCPVLDKSKVLETLESLPDSINPKTDKRWQYVTRTNYVNGEFEEQAVGIKPVMKRVGEFIIGRYNPDWELVQDAATSSVNEIPPPKAVSSHTIKLEMNDKPNTEKAFVWPWIVVAAVVVLLWFSLT